VIAVAHVHELRGDPQPVARLAHAAFDNGLDAEAFADLADAQPLALELER